jgi:predicted dehydrogenase
VIVTTHTDSHREPVEQAVAQGKRVYLDKPISVTLAMQRRSPGPKSARASRS